MRFHLAGIVEDGARLAPRCERAVLAVSAVGEALGEITNPMLEGQPLQDGTRLSQERDAQRDRRRDDPARDLILPLGLVVERAVRLEESDGHAGLGRQGTKSRHLVSDELLDLLRRDLPLAAAETLPVRITGMGADRNVAGPGIAEGLPDHL